MIPRDYLESLPTDTMDAVDFGDRVSSLFFKNGKWWYRLGNETLPLFPFQIFNSPQASVTFGVPIIFNHGFTNFNPLTSYFSATAFLINTKAEDGYVPGDIITPLYGVAFEITATQLITHIEDGGVDMIRKDNGKDRRIDEDNWNLFVKAIAI